MKRFFVLLAMTGFLIASSVAANAQNAPASTGSPQVLNKQQTAAILPQAVFYRGQSASIQGRNSGGLKLPGGKLVLFTMVDTSGYSTSVKETYQAYLLTEVPLTIGGQTLAPGAYGFGFIEGNKMVVMDIGANQVFTATTTRDDAFARPTPLQVLADAASGSYRLYLGRSYITFAPAGQ